MIKEALLKKLEGDVAVAEADLRTFLAQPIGVAEHIDYNTDYSIRFHIPITTNKDCGFYCLVNGERVYQTMEPGSCWFLNQGLRHSAWNKGTTARSHIIVSVDGQDDLQEMA